jgi:hypothetical protein
MEEKLDSVLQSVKDAKLPELSVTVKNHDRILWAVASSALGGLGLSLWLIFQSKPHG